MNQRDFGENLKSGTQQRTEEAMDIKYFTNSGCWLLEGFRKAK